MERVVPITEHIFSHTLAVCLDLGSQEQVGARVTLGRKSEKRTPTSMERADRTFGGHSWNKVNTSAQKTVLITATKGAELLATVSTPEEGAHMGEM